MSINNQINLYPSTLDINGITLKYRQVFDYKDSKIISDLYCPGVGGSAIAQTLFRVAISNPQKLILDITGKIFTKKINLDDEFDIQSFIKTKSNSPELKEAIIENNAIKNYYIHLHKNLNASLYL